MESLTFSSWVLIRVDCVKSVQLGISPLSWTNDVLEELGGDIPLERCLSEASKAGYQGIELGRKFPRDAHLLTPLLSAYDLQLISGWYSGFLAERSIEEEYKAVRNYAGFLSELGARVMVYGECGCMPGATPLDEPLSKSPSLSCIDSLAYAERVALFSEKLESDFGIGLAYHYHLMMLVETSEEIDTFFSQTGDNVGIVLDTGHSAAGGADDIEIIARWGSRIKHIHLKDIRAGVLKNIRDKDESFNNGVRAGMFTIPGDGDLDFSPVVDFVNKSNYTGWLVVEAEQDPVKAPPFETVKRAFNYVTSQFSFKDIV